jgi:hypothetical protein
MIFDPLTTKSDTGIGSIFPIVAGYRERKGKTL